MKKHLFVFLIFIFLIGIVSGCSKGSAKNPTSEDALYEIYVALEVYGGEKSFAVIKKYGLDKRENLTKYHEALRTLSTNEEKWKNFLKRVEKVRQSHTRSRINRRN